MGEEPVLLVVGEPVLPLVEEPTLSVLEKLTFGRGSYPYCERRNEKRECNKKKTLVDFCTPSLRVRMYSNAFQLLHYYFS